MNTLPDISEYYRPDRAMAEEVEWVLNQTQLLHWKFLRPRLARHLGEAPRVIEFGCGSGILAEMLPPGVVYAGVDANAWFLDRARERHKSAAARRDFYQGDVRSFSQGTGGQGRFDLAMAWQFLKHFSLAEWPSILGRVLAAGEYGAFDVQLLGRDMDDGTAFHHSYVSEQALADAIHAAGHEEVEREMLQEWAISSGEVCRLVAVWTRRIPDPPEAKWTQELAIEGEAVPPADLWRYSLRWVQRGDRSLPVLYRDGRRITRAWRLGLDVDVPADPSGGNANTAEGS